MSMRKRASSDEANYENGADSVHRASTPSDPDDEGKTRCICGSDDDELGFMIQCETCNCWQHGICMGLKDETECPDMYFCEQCRPNLHVNIIPQGGSGPPFDSQRAEALNQNRGLVARAQPPRRKRRRILAPVQNNTSVKPVATTSADVDRPSEEAALPEIEDIAGYITMSSNQATNVTGHFCDLFAGTHVSYGKVALKRPRIGPQEYTRADVRRFMREADTWRGLDHPFILRFIGTCRIEGYLYMVSPFVNNGTLSEYLDAHPEADRARLLYETAEALAYLHRMGIIHGDIKATNVLVSDAIQALLCDFGLTKFATSSTSTALKSAGSLRWQSPELWEEGTPKTLQSDTYAFGMTVAEVLSGKVPFAQYEQPCGVIMAAGFRNERPPTEPMFSITGAPYYPSWRAAIHCWVKDPAHRLSMEKVTQMLKPEVDSRTDARVSAGNAPSVLHEAAGPDVSKPSNSGPATEEQFEEERVSDEDVVYCYCNGDSDGAMIPCHGRDCAIEWFHPKCLGMKSKLPDEYFCLRCEAEMIGK